MKSTTYEMQVLLSTPLGEVAELQKAGTPLENPFVYDAAARDLKTLASEGRLEVVGEVRGAQDLITSFSFKRLH